MEEGWPGTSEIVDTFYNYNAVGVHFFGNGYFIESF